MLQLQEVSKRYGHSQVLTQISLNQTQGQNLAIMGASGAGKSTLLKIIAGAVTPDSGALFFNGKPLTIHDYNILGMHPKISYLHQDFNLPHQYSVSEIIHYNNQLSANDTRQLCAYCHIEHLMHRKTNEGLSGGERQRVALARLLTQRPQLLLLDEPFTNLDLVHSSLMKKVIRLLQQNLQLSIVMSSHLPGEILEWAHQLVILENGSIAQTGTPQHIYYNPTSEYVAALLGEYSLGTDALNALIHSEGPAIPNFMRPNQLVIHKNEAGNGIVKAIRFFGNYFLVDVQIASTQITSASVQNRYQVGDRVQVAFDHTLTLNV